MQNVFPLKMHFKNTIGPHVYSLKYSKQNAQIIIYILNVSPDFKGRERPFLFSYSPNKYLLKDFCMLGIVLGTKEHDRTLLSKKKKKLKLQGVKSLQSYLTHCNPMDYSPPGSPVHGILQARTLEWAVMPSSRGSPQPRE